MVPPVRISQIFSKARLTKNQSGVHLFLSKSYTVNSRRERHHFHLIIKSSILPVAKQGNAKKRVVLSCTQKGPVINGVIQRTLESCRIHLLLRILQYRKMA